MRENILTILAEPKRLEALVNVQLIDTPAEEAFDRLTRLASMILKTPVSLVSLVEPKRQFIKSQTGLPEPWASLRETPISHSFCQHVVATGEPLIIEDARLHPLVCDNPAVHELNVISYLGIPLTSPEGWLLGSFCVIDSEPRVWTQEDIQTMHTLAHAVTTEMKLRLEVREKEEMIAELQARNAELDAFSHTVSHNLKNPVSGITGWVSVSTRYADRMLQEEFADLMDKIGELATQANSIIDSLLLLARIHRAEDVPYQELAMFDILDDALLRLENEIVSHQVMVHLPDAQLFPRCIGYRQWVEEVWMNYISNAIKYGGKPPTITFGAEQLLNGFVRYWITDNGKGLSSEEQSALFVPFTRLAETAQIPGHGLGLSIVVAIVKKLGGDVGVSSEIGVGSTFSFTLPAKSEF